MGLTRKFIIVWAALFLMVPRASGETQPNIILIISDDQSWTDFGFMGHPAIETPHIDRLAKESLTFTRGYVPGSLCRCSLASLVTGLYPHQHKITGNDPPKGTDRNDMLAHIVSCDTVPGLLKDKGYISLQTGKWWEGSHTLGGFTHGMTHGDTSKGGRHGDEGLKIGREGLQPIYDFIEKRDDQPFFVWYAPFLPHRPHNPPERLAEKYRAEGRSPHMAKYWAMCEWFDETVGEILGYLDESGLRDDTIIAFVVDNGWIQLEEKQGYAPRSKRSPYDGGLRTPIMLRWPDKIKPELDDSTNVSSLDLVATLMDLTGIDKPDVMTGLNLTGEDIKSRKAIFGEIFSHDAVDIHNPASSLKYRWTIQGDWKLILPNSSDETPELYNLLKDPYEKNNTVSNETQKFEEMSKEINRWWPGN
jgi:uncharacterized sulfatase